MFSKCDSQTLLGAVIGNWYEDVVTRSWHGRECKLWSSFRDRLERLHRHSRKSEHEVTSCTTGRHL